MTMEEVNSRLDLLQGTLSQLEERHDREVMDLKEENITLKRQLVDIEKELINYTKTSVKRKHKSEKLEMEVKNLQKEMNEFRQKFQLLDGLRKSLNRVLVPAQKNAELKKKVETLEHVEDQITRLGEQFRDVEIRVLQLESVADPITSFEGQLHGMKDEQAHFHRQLGVIKRRLDESQQNSHHHETKALFDTLICTTEDLSQRRKLNLCTFSMNSIDNPFCKRTCALNPPVDGHYALNARVCQYGEGQLKVFFGMDGVDKGDYLGLTHGENDVLGCFKIWKLKKGQKIWLEVARVRGDCKLGWCSFSGWNLRACSWDRCLTL